MERVEQTETTCFEPRWPAVLAILAVIGELALLPGRLKLAPDWVPYAAGIVVLSPIVAVWLATPKTLWVSVERITILVFFAFATMGSLANLANLIGAILHRSKEINGLELLASSIGLWVTNVLTFSLLYWQLDRGGPEARTNRVGMQPDWIFPHEAAPAGAVPSGWRPTFVNYLYLSFSTSTSFSPNFAMPITSRAALLMMLESSISLTTIVVVAARAISVLS